MPTNVMLDLETLGQSAGCAILSIGACVFYPGAAEPIGATYETVVHTSSCLAAGLFIDPQTEAWWRKQTAAARQVLDLARDPDIAVPLDFALGDFRDWLTHVASGPLCLVWGNGADFDNAILAAAYRACRMPLPWHYWNSRCHHTLRALCPAIARERDAPAHRALDDAVAQARHAARMLRHLGRAV